MHCTQCAMVHGALGIAWWTPCSLSHVRSITNLLVWYKRLIISLCLCGEFGWEHLLGPNCKGTLRRSASTSWLVTWHWAEQYPYSVVAGSPARLKGWYFTLCCSEHIQRPELQAYYGCRFQSWWWVGHLRKILNSLSFLKKNKYMHGRSSQS
jgi:hypothetical protein